MPRPPRVPERLPPSFIEVMKQFSYEFLAGPLASEGELKGNWDTGNCRRAVQLYIFEEFGIFLRPEQVLCPAAYRTTGSFVFKKGQSIDFTVLKKGDILYAERIRTKEGERVDKSENTFSSSDEYIISLHTAIYTAEQNKEIGHATSIEGNSCYWSLEKFLQFYRPVAAKRIKS